MNNKLTSSPESNIHNDEEKSSRWQRLKKLFKSSPKTTEDMVALVDAANENEVIDNDAKRIIEGALEVSEMQTRDIMIPRTQMTVLKASDSFAKNLGIIINSGHSRYPVIGETVDEIQGILLSKDLLKLIASTEVETSDKENAEIKVSRFETPQQKNISELLRPPIFVPESKRLNVLLKQFREDRNHMALVIDEYGSLAGLITIEDVLEEIVGEIEDEHDANTDQHIRKLSDSHYVINALTPIDDFNDYFDAKIEDDEFDTIGGIVTNKFGHLPKRNEKINLNNYTFHIMQADSRRLRMLRMTIEEEIEQKTEQEEG